ncbi:helix-turn-helix domain-containing protein [Pseudomonas sp. ODNR1LW]|nr:helix-turn-helix domain-containing protein [Pseudomonas sp. ODNR1LW]
MEGHGTAKFRDASLLATSADRPWCLIAAEIRSHGAGEIGAFTPQNAEITQILRDEHEAVSTRASGGVRQEVAARPGTTWLCPAGIREEATRLSADIPRVLHVYIPQHSFLSGEVSCLNFRAQDLRYQAAVDNPRILSLLRAIQLELRCEGAAGGLRMDTLALELISALAEDHAEAGRAAARPRGYGVLDRRRLDRVLTFINENLERDLSLSDLAEVACVSVFHFARLFQQTIGAAPHAYLSERRLDVARQKLAYGSDSLAQIALACRFSSQSNFTRAFTRATGGSPGRYRLAMQGG